MEVMKEAIQEVEEQKMDVSKELVALWIGAPKVI